MWKDAAARRWRARATTKRVGWSAPPSEISLSVPANWSTVSIRSTGKFSLVVVIFEVRTPYPLTPIDIFQTQMRYIYAVIRL
jgi:hypothetical protein